MTTKRVRGIIGEVEPFLSCSKVSKLRVFDAILQTSATLYGAHSIGSYDDPYASIVYSIEIDSDKVDQFEKIAKAKLTKHDDIQVGRDVYKSVKAIIYE
jgi:hypothetical protein